MKIRNYILAFLGISSVAMATYNFTCINQDEFLKTLKIKLKSYNEKYPLEKIYAHVDKPLYTQGEDIWFKLYVCDGITHKPSQISNVVYAELIDPKGNIKKRLTLPVKNGGAKGDYHLDNDDPGGIYKIKAYTSWLKNFGESYFFTKEITVQKIVTPRLLMNLDFEKKAYGPGDEVKAKFTIKTLENEPLSNYPVKYSISLKGHEFHTGKQQTGKNGKATIIFLLPENLETNDGILNIMISYEGNNESISRSVPIVLNDIDLQFFPEGGNCVESVENKIAFKAVNEFGKPADIKGIIKNSKGDTVQHFKSYYHGMGACILIPAENEEYTAHLTTPKGITKTYSLPKALKTGHVLRVDTITNNKIYLQVYDPDNNNFSLVLQARGKIYFTSVYSGKNKFQQIVIPVQECPAGIAQLTLFDNMGIAKAERLVFINKNKNLQIKISTDKQEYGPREKVKLNIKTVDELNNPVTSTISVAVVNEKIISFMDDKQDNILSLLLLTSELKGKIEEPSFYFKKDEPKAEKALDYLLMTQGWRRFTWKEVIHPEHKISHMPEKDGIISGKLANQYNYPVNAKVYLLEMGNQCRLEKIRTDEKGNFIFIGADPSVPKYLFTKSFWFKEKNLHFELHQQSLNDMALLPPDIDMKIIIPEVIKPMVTEKEPDNNNQTAKNKRDRRDEKPKIEENQINNIQLNEDIQALDEVVVIGYGSVNKKELTGTVISVTTNQVNAMPPNHSIEQVLQGRVAGLVINNSNEVPGAKTNVKIRGNSGIGVTNQPLYVVDGIPLSPGIDEALPNLSFLNPDDIDGIDIIKDASATAIYGSRAANGVIVITTKNANSSLNRKSKQIQNQYAYLPVNSRVYSQTREFYTPVYHSLSEDTKRTDFRSTIFWDPNVHTNKRGEATLTFYNSDEITTFNTIAEGIGSNGLVGREEYKYHTQLPFSMDIKIPPYMVFNDTVYIPLILKNNTANIIKGNLTITIPFCLETTSPLPDSISLEKYEAKTVFLGFKVKNIAGRFNIQITFNSLVYSDKFEKEIEIFPVGFPAKVNYSGNEVEKIIEFSMNDIIPGSLTGRFTAYPNVLSDLMSGIESILREPYGCFEQTSSSTYPNIMVLKYMEETGNIDKNIRNKALNLIKKGYKRLISFETSEDGYEWFGSSPAHDGLTAYGLMEFTDMKHIYEGVDESMLNRTLQWILKQRDGNGGFFKSQRALDQFGRASREVTNAYLVYALSEYGYKKIKQEYNKALNEAMELKDPYRMALMANTAYNLALNTDGDQLLGLLEDKIKEKSWDEIEIDHSITRSYGKSLKVETAALFVLAEFKSGKSNMKSLNKSIDYLVHSRDYGGFGSTQATILALKALTGYARFNRSSPGGGRIALSYHNNLINSVDYTMKSKDEIRIDSLEKYQEQGLQSFTVKYENTDNPLPYSLDFSWTSRTPASSPECKVDLTTSISKENAIMGELVRISAILSNKTGKGLPMTIAVVGIPSGLSLQPWQLKEIQEKGIVDFYEIRKNYLVLYYRQMMPNEQKVVKLDLKSDIPGVYQAPASAAYLYYTNEYKDWEAGEKVRVSID